VRKYVRKIKKCGKSEKSYTPLCENWRISNKLRHITKEKKTLLAAMRLLKARPTTAV
jgi:hypothetical protein